MDPNKPGALNKLFTKEDYEKEAAKPKPVEVFVRPPRPAPMTELTGLTDDMKLPKKGCPHCIGTGWVWLHAIPELKNVDGLAFSYPKPVRRWTLCTCMTRKTVTHSKLGNMVPHNPKPVKHTTSTSFRYRLKTMQERADAGEWLSHREKREMKLRERLHKQIELESKMKDLGQGKLF